MATPHQGAGHEAAHRLPLLRLVGRPGQAGQAGGVGQPDASPSCATPSTTTPSTCSTRWQNQGTTADMVQIGNEINPGMLLPTGSTTNWGNLAQLLTAGRQRGQGGQPRRPGSCCTWPRAATTRCSAGGSTTPSSRGVPFDVIGASYYPYWHGSLSGLQANLNDMAARYNKPVVVVGDGVRLHAGAGRLRAEHLQLVAAAGRRVSRPRAQGQADAFRAVVNVVRNVPNGRGIGLLLLGAGVDRAHRCRLGPDQPELGQRLGEPGPVRLQRPRAARPVGLRHADVPMTRCRRGPTTGDRKCARLQPSAHAHGRPGPRPAGTTSVGPHGAVR